MKEKERNKRLLMLTQKLIVVNDIESLELLKTMVDNDTPAMQKSFEIMTGIYFEKPMFESSKLTPMFESTNNMYCDCKKPWGVGGRCVMCGRPVMIVTN